MNILVLPSWYPNDAQDINGSFFREQALALVKAGHHVTVADAGFRNSSYLFNKSNNRVNCINDCGLKVYSCKSVSLGRSRFDRWGLSIYRKNINKIVRRLVKEDTHFDLIHVHSFWCAGVAAIKLSEIFKCPFVLTEHSSGFIFKSLTKYQIEKLKQIYAYAAKIICVSSELKSRMIQYCEDDKKFIVIPNIVNDMFFYEIKNKNSNNKLIFISIGALKTYKGHLFNISCFLESFRDISDVQLKIIGVGKEYNTIKNFIKANEASEKVLLLGKKSREEVLEELIQSDVFVLVSSIETFGVVYIEALACGLPLIAAKNAGAVEIVTDENGILIDIDNKTQLIDAYQFMYRNREQYDYKKIQTDCQTRFSEKSVIHQIEEVYKEVLHAGPNNGENSNVNQNQ